MEIHDVIEKAAGELPPGATMSIAIENGSAHIEASNINDEVFNVDTADMTLVEEFLTALQWCKDTTERSA